ncbi:hypothetical protein RN001_008879 [Aquatica leii]|uniref:Uncharacterized protein n=1 Tax=Aquatica leii TaxID=1421715 RepID=A0AAN7PB75_9COLE|nr:hypothetical protein RN001_008879 [Aquatica leii]
MLNIRLPKERINELNTFIDKSLESLREALGKSTLDPLQLPSYNTSFISGTLYGNITLHKGYLAGISSVDRFGNVIIMYKYPMIRVHIPLELMGISATNLLNGTISSCNFLFDFIVNVKTISIFRNQFKVNELGQISISLGDRYSGFAVDILISVVKPLLVPIIKSTIEKQVGDALDSVIDLVGFAEEEYEPAEIQTNFTFEGKESLLKIKDVVQCARKGTTNDQEMLLNDYIDQTFEKAKVLILQLRLDPLHIVIPPNPDSQVKISKGVITGLSTILRKGSVSVSSKSRRVQVIVPIGFEKISFEFDYEIPISKGQIVGFVEGCVFQANIQVNLMYIRFKIDNFKIKNLGRVDVRLPGSAVGYTTGAVVKTLQPFWEPLLYVTIQEYVQKTLLKIFDEVNNTTCTLLGNCDVVLSAIF